MDFPSSTRKPYSASEAAMMFAAGIGRPGDVIGNVGIDDTITEFRPGKGREYFWRFESYGTPIALMSENLLTAWVVNKSYSITTSGHQSTVRWELHKAGFRETGKAIWREDMAYSRYYKSSGKIEYTEYKRLARDRDNAVEKALAEVWEASRRTPYIPSKDRPKPRPVKFYKVLNEFGQAMHGGTFEYDLPQYNEDDNIWIPGAWTPTIEDVDLCMRGYHVTAYPPKWFSYAVNVRIFEVEYRGRFEFDSRDHKVAFQSIRLVREISRIEALSILDNRLVYNERAIRASSWSMRKEKVA